MHRSTTYHSTSYFAEDVYRIGPESSLRDRYEILNQWRALIKPVHIYTTPQLILENQRILLDLREFIESKDPAKFIECMNLAGSLGLYSLNAVKLFLIFDFDVNIEYNNRFILSYAFEVDDIFDELKDLLYGFGADVNICDENDTSILQKAASCGHENAVTWLLSKGADANNRDIFGSSIMWSAFMSEEIDIAKILVEHGAKDSKLYNAVKRLPEDHIHASIKRKALEFLESLDDTVKERFGVHQN